MRAVLPYTDTVLHNSDSDQRRGATAFTRWDSVRGMHYFHEEDTYNIAVGVCPLCWEPLAAGLSDETRGCTFTPCLNLACEAGAPIAWGIDGGVPYHRPFRLDSGDPAGWNEVRTEAKRNRQLSMRWQRRFVGIFPGGRRDWCEHYAKTQPLPAARQVTRWPGVKHSLILVHKDTVRRDGLYVRAIDVYLIRERTCPLCWHPLDPDTAETHIDGLTSLACTNSYCDGEGYGYTTNDANAPFVSCEHVVEPRLPVA
jgi:hypothetical protein